MASSTPIEEVWRDYVIQHASSEHNVPACSLVIDDRMGLRQLDTPLDFDGRLGSKTPAQRFVFDCRNG